MFEKKLLDCTLRDGGYVNDWKFGQQSIQGMLELLERTGTEIIELGFLKDEPYQEDRTVFRSMEQVKKLIGKKKSGRQYAVMAEVVNPLPLSLLAPADADSADIIRVIVWKTKHDENGQVTDALKEGYEYCKGIADRGYRLCVQPARVDQYSDDEFTAMVRQFSALDPMGIYVVDSWGTQNAETLLHYMYLADRCMPEKTALGYHGHNNLMQALSTAQALLKEDFQRDIIIDASVYGIGRGAGNLNLEIIAKYMNEYYGKSYKLEEMMMIYERYIKKIYGQEPWGYSAAYYITARYGCNPGYAGYYQNEKGLSVERMEKIIRNMKPQDRVMFTKERAEQYLLMESAGLQYNTEIRTVRR